MTRSSNKPLRARRWTPLSLLCAPASLLLSLHPQAATASMGLPGVAVIVPLVGVPNQVDGLSVEELDDGTTVLRLKGTLKPTFNVYRLSDPDRLVVDIAKSAKGQVVPHVPLDTWACGRVTVGAVSERGANLVRVVVELKREASYIVVPDGDTLVVTVTPREAPPEQYFSRKSASKRKAEMQSQHLRAKQLEADATKLKAAASAEAKAARANAEVATKKVRSAEAAAKQARAAESRARASEAEAQRELKGAKSNRLQVRRALKKATQAREKAESDRKAAEQKLAAAETTAQAKRKNAERLLADAEAVARKRLAEAAKSKAQAQRELADARGSKEAAKLELKVARAEAVKSKAASARRLADAEANAKSAKSDADRAKRAATHADAEAKKKLAAAESKATARLAAARSEVAAAKKSVASAESRAKVRLAAAQSDASAAEKRASDAEVRAKKVAAAAEAKAQARLAQADRNARATEAEADRLAKVTEAEAARLAKVTEAKASRMARATEAKAEQRAAVILASARERAAKDSAKELAGAKRAADALVAKARTDATALKKKRLAEAEADATAKVARAERDARDSAQKRLDAAEAEAEQQLASARKKAEKDAIKRAEKELARVRSRGESEVAAAAKTARSKAQTDAKKELLAERTRIEADAKRRVAAAESKAAKAEAAAESKMARADAMLASASRTLAEAKADRAAAQKLQKTAEVKLASAEAARKRAVSEKANAAKDRQVSEKALVQARAAADSKRGLARRRASARIADAEKSRDAAVARQTAASKKLGTLERETENARSARDAARTDKVQAEAQLAALAKERDSLKSQLARRDAEIAAMQAKIDEAPAKERDALRAQLAQRTSELAAVQSKIDEAPAKKERDALKVQLAQRTAELAAMELKIERAAAKTPVKTASAPAKSKKNKRSARGPAKVKDVRFENDGSESRVIVEFDGAARYEGMTLTPTIQMLRFSNAKLSRKLERSLDASKYDGSVRVVTSFAEGDDAKVIVSTQGPVAPRLEEKPGMLIWHFPNAKGPKTTPHAPSRVASAKAPKRPAAAPQAVSVDGAKVGGFASVPTPRSNLAPALGGSGQADVTQGRRSSRGRWRGERIDIELQDAPIKDVLLLFSDIGRVNIVAGDGVEGSVTMKLNSVPWDQALDIILRSLKLGSAREGNVIRIATLTALQEEQRQAIERANARVQLKPLETRLVPLSYATVDEMVAKVQSVLSPRGTVTPDTRTNTLIIMDVAANIALAQDLVKSLDTQTPQVLIEARIVEARTTFTRQLGIQWGFDFTASPGTGNPTGLLFPNSVGVGGGGTGTPTDARGLLLPGAAASPNYAVDLPAPVGTGAGGAVGMSFGSISGNLNTNLRLSAAESTGEVRIISAPKIVTLDNSEATIEQGVQIPISQVSAQGVNTRFVNATLSLVVTPHVTNEGAVLLDVTVQKNEADFVNTGARGDPTILTRSANSRMLVNDADTAVIGGIYTRNKAVNYTKIPWLADIPIVGWFFKSKAEADTRSEVLIFLTPKIVNRASSIGG